MIPENPPHTPALHLSELFDLRREQPDGHDAAALCIAPRRAAGRWLVLDAAASATCGVWYALPRENVGDAPQKYHALYVAAILSARTDVSTPATSLPTSSVEPVARALPLTQWPIPQVAWTTATEVRRSMTLNGMRMSLEYAQTGSLRVLQLVESRLAVRQRDVAHDVLVYLMRQVMSVRANQQEARDLRAESIAAYLGLHEPRVRLLFAARRLSAASIGAAVTAGFAGPVRRSIDIPALIDSQVRHLRPQLQLLRDEEDKWLWLLDQIAVRLRSAP